MQGNGAPRNLGVPRLHVGVIYWGDRGTIRKEPVSGYLQTSIYLNADDRVMLDDLQERTGMNRSELVRHALKSVYEGNGDEPSRRARLIEIAEEIKRLA